MLPPLIPVGCAQSSPRVTFVLPNDHHGVFVVKEESNGVELSGSKGIFLVRVPESGVVILKDASILTAWHTTSVEQADGRTIKYFYRDQHAEDTQIGCWGLFSTMDSHYYYIGKFSELKSLTGKKTSDLLQLLLKKMDKQ